MLHRESPRPKQQHPNNNHWDKIKDQALERDKKCRTCASGELLEAHHITYVRFGKEILEDVTILCRPCHQAITAVVRARREKQEPEDIHEEVLMGGGDLRSVTSILQRHDDILAEIHLFLETQRRKNRTIRKNLSDVISSKICTIIENSSCDCTAEYLCNFLKEEASKQTVQKRLNVLVNQGVLKTKSAATYKKGRPPVIYVLAKLK